MEVVGLAGLCWRFLARLWLDSNLVRFSLDICQLKSVRERGI